MKNDFKTYNRIYAEYFSDNQPCRTTVEIKSLPTSYCYRTKSYRYHLMSKYPEYKQLNLAQIGQEVLKSGKLNALLKRVCPQEKESLLLPFMKDLLQQMVCQVFTMSWDAHQRYILSLQNLTRIPSTPKSGLGHTRATCRARC